MTDKFELDKKFQGLPEHAQVCAAEALRNTLSQGVDADAQSSEQIGRNIKKAFIALFEVESNASTIDIQIGDGGAYPCEALKRPVMATANIDEAYILGLLRKGKLMEQQYNDNKDT